ncbi:hypothetical protein B0J14DRAFT_579036 [Halenospora varia]|nr:hypothetical protein B0J14DRAFT_579036 [Halenospora varia]
MNHSQRCPLMCLFYTRGRHPRSGLIIAYCALALAFLVPQGLLPFVLLFSPRNSASLAPKHEQNKYTIPNADRSRNVTTIEYRILSRMRRRTTLPLSSLGSCHLGARPQLVYLLICNYSGLADRSSDWVQPSRLIPQLERRSCAFQAKISFPHCMGKSLHPTTSEFERTPSNLNFCLADEDLYVFKDILSHVPLPLPRVSFGPCISIPQPIQTAKNCVFKPSTP